jgi:hypothetical protein
MFKVSLKLLLCIIIYTIVYIIASAILPTSQSLMEANSAINPMTFIMYLPIKALCLCLIMYFIIRNTYYGGKKLLLNLILIMFFIPSFTQHIDTLFIGSAFPAMTRLDVVTTILSGLFSLLIATPLLVYFFQNKNNEVEKSELKIKNLILKLGIIGIIYLCFYLLFGFLLIMRLEENRIFYNSLDVNIIVLILFQIMRGILLGIFISPLKNMIKTKKIFIISVCLVYLCMAVDLIIPNALLPTNIRIFHFIEMTTEMTIFGIIVGNIIWGKQKTSV